MITLVNLLTLAASESTKWHPPKPVSQKLISWVQKQVIRGIQGILHQKQHPNQNQTKPILTLTPNPSPYPNFHLTICPAGDSLQATRLLLHIIVSDVIHEVYRWQIFGSHGLGGCWIVFASSHAVSSCKCFAQISSFLCIHFWTCHEDLVSGKPLWSRWTWGKVAQTPCESSGEPVWDTNQLEVILVKGAVSPIVPSAPKCSSRHFIFHRKYVCFE